jgi:hypothetical protein
MYRGFNICDVDLSDKYLESGKEMLNTHKKVIIRTLDNYVNDEGRLDGSLMQSSWFPTISTDVFISHSHSDEAQAIALAGALYDEFGLISFVDSCVWGYANNLLKQIDKIYCPTGRGTYDYDLRNRSTSHVHMMLASALSMMIDRAECLFFLNTPKSLSADDVIKKTMSPWIYYELMAFKYIKKPDRPRPVTKMLLDEQVIEKLALDVEYSVDFDDFVELSFDDLNLWRKYSKNKGISSLDVLYRLFPLESD